MLEKMRKTTSAVLLKFLLGAVAMLALPGSLHASHVLAAELTYRFVGFPNTNTAQYRVTLVQLRDISSGVFVGSESIQIRGTAACSGPTSLTVTMIKPEFQDTTSGLYQCLLGNATLANVGINILEGVLNVPTNCGPITLSWASCCRSLAMTGLSSPNTTGFYLETEILGTGTSVANSAPKFTSPWMAFLCSGNSVWIPHTAVDPDGDSIGYELISARIDLPLGSNVTYAAGRSYLQPLLTTPTGALAFDPRTGGIRVTPQGPQATVVTLRVSDYRWNPWYGMWLKMGSAVREVFVQVASNCGTSTTSLAIDSTRLGWTASAQGRPSLVANCGDTAISVAFATELITANLSNQDFRLTSDQGGIVPFKRLLADSASLRTDTVVFVLHQPLAPGSYHLVTGIFDASPVANVCNLSTAVDSLGTITVQNCAPLPQIACVGQGVCDTAVVTQGPHTYYSTWSIDTLGFVPAHQSQWSIDSGYFVTPSNRDTVTAMFTGSTVRVVLETRYSSCVEYDTLVVDNYFGEVERPRPVLQVRPNPAEDEVWVFGATTGSELLVINAFGQPVMRHRVVSGSSVRLDVSQLPKGTYWVAVVSAEGSLQTPFLKL
jgi:hypothetical protein